MTQIPAEPLVVARGLGKTYTSRGTPRVALTDVSFTVAPGETLAIVGESGAGKSTLSRLLAGLEQPTEGTITIAGEAPRIAPGRVSSVQMVFQNPIDAVNRYLSIERIVGEPIRRLPKAQRAARVADLLTQVGLDPSRARSRPRRFSGGQLQRVVLARALAADPRVLLCDEPTSALDVSVQAQIVNLLLGLQEELGFACLLVTHDLHVARVLAHQIVVLKDGRVVEQQEANAFFAGPESDYARRLLDAVGADASAASDAGRLHHA